MAATADRVMLKRLRRLAREGDVEARRELWRRAQRYGVRRVRLSNRAWLDRRTTDPEVLAKMRDALTVIPDPCPITHEPQRPIFVFESTPDWLGVPRDYYLDHAREEDLVAWQLEDGTGEAPPPWGEQYELRDYQKPAVEHVLRALRQRDDEDQTSRAHLDVMLTAPTGSGKTVMASALIGALGVPTVVLVNQQTLVGQWRDSLERFLPGCSVGMVQGDVCDLEGRHVAIVMIQSLLSRGVKGYPGLESFAGLVIMDEAHHASAREFAKAIEGFPARYRLGLTATPRRKDGTEEVFRWLLGPIAHEVKTLQLKPTIKRVFTNYDLPPHLTPLARDKVEKNDAKILKYMTANRARNWGVLNQVLRAEEAGRHILVASKRVDHLKALKAEFDGMWAAWQLRDHPEHCRRARRALAGNPTDRSFCRVQASLEGFEAPDTALCIGGVKGAELERIKREARVLWGTYQYVSEGFDIPRLDTLVMATPGSDVEQLVGRILRFVPGKKTPIVVDLVDRNIHKLMKKFRTRQEIYARLIEQAGGEEPDTA